MSVSVDLFIREYAVGKFGRKTVRSLQLRGMRIIGTQSLPNADGTWANCEVAYQVDDNGTCRVKTYGEVVALSKAAL